MNIDCASIWIRNQNVPHSPCRIYQSEYHIFIYIYLYRLLNCYSHCPVIVVHVEAAHIIIVQSCCHTLNQMIDSDHLRIYLYSLNCHLWSFVFHKTILLRSLSQSTHATTPEDCGVESHFSASYLVIFKSSSLSLLSRDKRFDYDKNGNRKHWHQFDRICLKSAS